MISKYKQLEIELKKYRFCGWILLLMNVSVSIIIFFMIYWNRTFVHHEITTIALAAYTFFTFTLAIINLVKYRKYNSPIYIATKSINLVVFSKSSLFSSIFLFTFFILTCVISIFLCICLICLMSSGVIFLSLLWFKNSIIFLSLESL